MTGLAGLVAFVVCPRACQQVAAQGEDAEPEQHIRGFFVMRS